MKIIILNGHKTGFTLTNKIVNIIKSVILLPIEIRTFYSFWDIYSSTEKYIIITRDPREIIISGYLYHKKCNETWCVNKGGNIYGYWQQNHFLKEQNNRHKDILEFGKTFSQNKCYQQKLKHMSIEEGIIYEMNTVAKVTIMGLYNLPHIGKSNVIMVKLEDLIFNHNHSIFNMCKFMELDEKKCSIIINKTEKLNLVYMKNKGQKLSNHVTNKNMQQHRYKQYWTKNIQKEFLKIFPKNVINKLGYIKMEYTNSPYKQIPQELKVIYTMNNKIPILNKWYNGKTALLNKLWDEKYLNSFLTRFTPDNIKKKRYGNEPYFNASLWLLQSFEKYNIKNKNVAVIGSTSPWIEAILLNLNNNVTTVEYNVPESKTKIICTNYSLFKKTKNMYDCIVTYSSVEHSGLGRYGDPLNPDEDLETMKIIHQNLKKNATLIWGAPVGKDALVWNAHRIYGPLRLPLLFKNFKEHDCISLKKSDLFNLSLGEFKQPVIVLSKDTEIN